MNHKGSANLWSSRKKMEGSQSSHSCSCSAAVPEWKQQRTDNAGMNGMAAFQSLTETKTSQSFQLWNANPCGGLGRAGTVIWFTFNYYIMNQSPIGWYLEGFFWKQCFNEKFYIQKFGRINCYKYYCDINSRCISLVGNLSFGS